VTEKKKEGMTVKELENELIKIAEKAKAVSGLYEKIEKRLAKKREQDKDDFPEYYVLQILEGAIDDVLPGINSARIMGLFNKFFGMTSSDSNDSG